MTTTTVDDAAPTSVVLLVGSFEHRGMTVRVSRHVTPTAGAGSTLWLAAVRADGEEVPIGIVRDVGVAPVFRPSQGATRAGLDGKSLLASALLLAGGTS